MSLIFTNLAFLMAMMRGETPAAEPVAPPPPPPAQPYTLAHLIGWADRQDPNERYDWNDCCDCPLGRYGAAHGFRASTDPYGHARAALRVHGMDSLREMTVKVAAQSEPWTFGAFSQRLHVLEASWANQ